MYILNVLIPGLRGKAIHYVADSVGAPFLCCEATARSSLWTRVPTDTVSPARKELERLGLRAEDVTSVMLTHWHTRTRGKGGIK
jgi:phosphoribosyl 1,2-cyclic phosphodiesterase